ncbi:conserved protein of unknown function [Nitrospira japonica]|uniref:Uncharacterized protein n=1 Tax=Nitrospira japonica TaxID=1325564 RepID=A0A1W1I8W5_9BACT|nr:hypothetical protein [Nitrospira japonica]SLM49478.1 conserved protein of unknown function [Nitrospira japonica]
MARSRRPELEKDNPSAPQTYVGRRRKRNTLHVDAEHGMIETLEHLTDAAERFINRVPRLRKHEAERLALLDAITQAQLTLSVHTVPSHHPVR